MFLYFYHFFAIFAVKQLIKKKRFDIMQKVEKLIGVSPSGKATDSDSVIREFKSLHPSQKCTISYCFVLKTLESSAFFVLIFARVQLFSPNFGMNLD